MANPVWPNTLPQRVDAPSFKEKPGSNTIRTAMDVGSAKVRRRTTASVRTVDATMMLSRAERDALDAFYTDTLKDGSLAFDWLHPTTQLAATFRFRDPPEFNAISGTTYVATLPLEILP